ncbi:hypothetical protein LXT21_31230 [Myxococcus sp. K38C18041901]|uniref:hypothetical protein n=1 Tax=Myxococcus guangdongensis TaxID=2906760 RepID=UPI0020A7BFC1|nr:hypothetical protein [Myxococcus guangdongensis]MCP3063260.1 hypothetical protein [Myxococcus guangdongensis]
MVLSRFFASLPSLPLFRTAPRREPGSLLGEAPLKAVRMLGVVRLAEARERAEHALRGARRCSCCRALLEHLHDRIGSTLFLDDDPEQLACAFDAQERDGFAARVLAACIVLSGRERVAPAL